MAGRVTPRFPSAAPALRGLLAASAGFKAHRHEPGEAQRNRGGWAPRNLLMEMEILPRERRVLPTEGPSRQGPVAGVRPTAPAGSTGGGSGAAPALGSRKVLGHGRVGGIPGGPGRDSQAH